MAFRRMGLTDRQGDGLTEGADGAGGPAVAERTGQREGAEGVAGLSFLSTMALNWRTDKSDLPTEN